MRRPFVHPVHPLHTDMHHTKRTRRWRRLRPGVAGLAEGKGDVTVLDHVLNLSPHRQGEEDDPVDDENGPED